MLLLSCALAVGLADTARPVEPETSTPYTDIASRGPLTHVYVGNELSCQVAYRGDKQLELFPQDNKPGDCGTFLAVGKQLWRPDFGRHSLEGGSAFLSGDGKPFTALSQTDVTGAGTASDPFVVVTRVGAAPTGIEITQTDSYVVGDSTFKTKVTISNPGAAVDATLYRAGDCYLQENDKGFGFVRFGKAVGCSANKDNLPPARVEQWVPIDRSGARYYQAKYSEVWEAVISRKPFPNLCRCLHRVDNGAGVSWSLTLPASGTVSRSHYTTFSPKGVGGTPLSDDRTPPEIYVSKVPACAHKSFRARVNVLDASPLRRVDIFLDGRHVKRTRAPLTPLPVSVAGLRRGSHRISAKAIDARGNRGSGGESFRTGC